MGLKDIFLLAGLLILLRLIPKSVIRHGLLIVCSCVFLFLFQPVLPVRELDFTFPMLTALLTVCVYTAFSAGNPLKNKQNAAEIGLIFLCLLLTAATRFLSYDGVITVSRPPQLRRVLPTVVCGALVCCLFTLRPLKERKWPVILKTPALSLLFSRTARGFTGQDPEMALSTDIRWFGFSYIAFRLLSILIDSLKGRKAELSAGEFFIYVCFPPALSAGPIDRWDRFAKDYKAGPKGGFAEDLFEGGGQFFR